MKNISKVLVACLLHGAAFAGTYDQKTFLMSHHPVHSQLMEQALFRTHRHTAALEQGGHVQATAFYGESMNKSAIGQYFGVGNGKNSFKVGSELNANVVADTTNDLDGGYLIHNQANPTAQAVALAGKITLLPKQTVYGVNLTYRQAFLGACGRNFFFQVSAPIVQVRNNLGFSVANEIKVNLGAGAEYGLADFFDGKVNVAANNVNTQTGLTKGKMVARSLYATGLADLNLQLGYKMVCKDDRHADVYLRGIVPTGNKSTGEYLFEPLVGNNNHYGLGLGLDADMTLWHEADKGRLSLQGSAAYTYLFESTETRMPGINRRRDDSFKYNQYGLIGKPGDVSVAPATNVLTQDFRVRPGSQLELMTGLSFHSQGGVSVNVGYNMNWREAEGVYRKANDVFTDVYAVAPKQMIMNAVVPTNPAAGAAPVVGLLSSSDQTVARYRSTAVFDAAVAQAAAANDGAALQEALVHAGGGNQAGVGTNAGATAIVAAPPHANELPAYQAGAKLFAATGIDILADVTVGTAIAAVNGRAEAVRDAIAARNYIANVQNVGAIESSVADSIRQESLITHVLGASLGYSFDVVHGFPLMVGVGGQYELPHSSNVGLESYKLFVKAGVSF